jgi:MYXO-CTERM domain-containing protein
MAVVGAPAPVLAADPTYFADVLPLVRDRCLPCHDVGGVAALDLVDVDVASPFAGRMAQQTAAGLMPPFPPDPACADYREHAARSLTPAEIDLVRAWADAGAPAGDPTDALPPRLPPPDPLGPPDDLLTPDSAFVFDADDPDIYWCTRFDPDLDDPRHVVAAHVHPDNDALVHHVIVFRERGGAQRDPVGSPGFPCPGAPEDGEFLVGWAPGSAPVVLPDGYGLPLGPDDALVMQVHYHAQPGAEPTDRSSVALWYASAPIEREVMVMWTGSFEIFVPPGTSRTVEGECVLPGDDAIELVGIAPHMHRIGTSIRARLDRVDGGESCLVDVPRWDFDWQGSYTYVEPIVARPGDRIHTTCEYQNDGEQTVGWGEGSDDEMCFAFHLVAAPAGFPEHCFATAPDEPVAACGCAGGDGPGAGLFALAGVLVRRRRRRPGAVEG